ncbi:CobW family GTP-binding protein [Beggiatoa leptomitoformis]|uniref:GTP-binding protein n=1 Tax=Beggiatoa leptomitoformis TaxID=288004 RepID=A0A2N9YGS0_9GAMM|nr:GTP-binding protein [Beggiatoa leptomitoformis]ALG67961.1 GTP-binding protein [Beggiatoa leptomitoformis]AUI69761.1 GTP-binding protein [Beggiatoa leptomitoformis]
MQQQLPIDNALNRLPTAIITGFLGSGKTTLLNKLLKHPNLKNTAVIINEFGSVSLDHLLVQAATEDIVVIDGGCVCCTIRGDLVETLQGLFAKRSAGEIPCFDRLLIETTGLADPAPIIHTIMNDTVLRNIIQLDSVITTIDCVYGLRQLEEHYETTKQAAVADRLVLTKIELTNAEQIERLKHRLQRLNPAALQIESTEDNLIIERLFHAGLYNPQTKTPDVVAWLQAETYPDVHDIHEHHHTHNETIRHDKYIQSYCIEYNEPLSWVVLNRWFQQLTALRGKDLLRVKGIVYTKETDLPVIVQGVQHIFQPPTTLPQWPPNTPKASRIVFITRNIQKPVIERMLAVLVNSKSYVEACQAALILLECA